MKKTLVINGESHDCALIRTAQGYDLQAGSQRFGCALEAAGAGRYRVQAGTECREAHIAQYGDQVWIHVDGRAWQVQRVNPLDALAAQGRGAGGDSTLAPMPGTILGVQVQPGETVKAGQILLTMESMKLEVSINAPHDGVIAEVLCAPGQAVAVKAALVRFASAAEVQP